MQPRILEFIKDRYPKKIQHSEIIREFCKKDSRLTPHTVLKALSNLQRTRQALVDKQRYYWNPSPPKARAEQQRLQPEIDASILHLDERQIQKLPNILFACPGELIEAHTTKPGTKKGFLAYNFEQSNSILSELIIDLRKVRYSSIYFRDELGGFVKIWKYEGKLNGTYRNSNRKSFRLVENKMR